MRIIVFLALAACGPSFEQVSAEAERDNQRARAAADQRAARGGTAFAPAQVAIEEPAPPALSPPSDPSAKIATLVAGPGQHGLGDDERLYAAPDGQLAFLGMACALSSGSCGCDVAMSYRYLHAADGHVVVVRLRPEIRTRTIEVKGSCGFGCGQPPVPPHAMQPVQAMALGVSALDCVEVREESYALESIHEHCEHMIPAP